MKELFTKYPESFDIAQLQAEISLRETWWDYKNHIPYKEVLSSLEEGQTSLTQENGIIKILLNANENIEEKVQALTPWKKGPFQINDLLIDSEWKSDLKWDRIKNALPNLKDLKLLDVGCNNGYYMYRMLEQNPEFVLGLDPYLLYKAQFEFINHYAKASNLYFELLGAEHIQHMKNIFDGVFYMGILYHHRDPISHLVHIRESLTPGGWMLLETIGIPGEENYCLTPTDRYANMKNIWFVPTLKCLITWLERSKFVDIEIVSQDWDETDEQRVTKFGPSKSYNHFLDPKNPSLTIEGHPAPKRFALMARKKN